MHIRPFQAVYPNLEYITSTDSFFSSVKKEFPEYFDSGFFNHLEEEAFFVYQIRGEHRTYTGIIACADIKDFLCGRIKKHEHTLAAKEQKQVQLLLRRRAAVKPVLLAYREVPEITRWSREIADGTAPFLRVFFEKDRQTHSLWKVTDKPLIERLQLLFSQHINNTYIADGHHRTSSVALLYNRTEEEHVKARYRNLLCAFFPSSDMDIHDFNRVVEGRNNLSLTRFMALISQLFNINPLEEPVRPRRKHEILMFVNHEWYLLHWKHQVLQTYSSDEAILDSMILNELVLHDILGIEDVRTDKRVDYVEGPKGLEGVWERATVKESCIGFCLYPILLEEMMALADHDKMLPPKSTWFEPRLKNGLITYAI